MTIPLASVLWSWKKTGAQYSAELATLRASGAFEEYSRWDAANDTLLREDPILSKGNSVGRAVAGAAGAAKGEPAKWVAYETRDGVQMRVVYQPATGKVVTAFPDDAPTPPYKPMR